MLDAHRSNDVGQKLGDVLSAGRPVYNVAIARFPGDGWEHHACTDWLVTTVLAMKQDPRIGRIYRPKYVGQTPITCSRNKAVIDARMKGCAYLLMVDSDMHPDLYEQAGAPRFWDTAWEFMMKRREKEIEFHGERGPKALPPATIAAPYCGPPPEEFPFVFQMTNRESDNPNPDIKLEMISRPLASMMHGIQQMDALPTGLILYDIRVFEILPPPWFRYEYSDQTESVKVTTEDVYQTRNASFLGLPQFCAFDCWAGHAKGKLVGKPKILTRDQIHESFRESVLRGADRGDEIVMAGAPVLTDKAMSKDWNPPDEMLPEDYPDYWPDEARKDGHDQAT